MPRWYVLRRYLIVTQAGCSSGSAVAC